MGPSLLLYGVAQLPAASAASRDAIRKNSLVLDVMSGSLLHDEPDRTRRIGFGRSRWLVVDRVDPAEQDRFGIGRIDETVRRRREIGRDRRRHQIGADDDDEFGFVILEVAAPEERAEDGQVLYARERLDHLLGGMLHQAGDGKAAARGKFDRRLRAA